MIRKLTAKQREFVRLYKQLSPAEKRECYQRMMVRVMAKATAKTEPSLN